MERQVGIMNLQDAIKAVENNTITYATFNKFQIRKNKVKKNVEIIQTGSTYTSFPANAGFVCFLETFEKEDLKPGMIVEIRDGSRYLVLDDGILNQNDDYDLTDYRDNLTNNRISHADIIKIYKRKWIDNLDNLLNNFNDCLELITEINKQ